jgi:S-disulfanyl-L-cysteine oxidoreductase SoxD
MSDWGSQRHAMRRFRRRAERGDVLLSVAAVLWTVCGLYATSAAARRQVPQDSVRSGVYSDAQAERGKAQYAENCATCHAGNLQGTDEGPGLVGEGFLSQWIDLSVNDLFERTRVSMPQDRPGQLSRVAYADIIAFLLKVNGFPAGAAELKADGAAMSRIKIVSAAQQRADD